MIRFFPRLVAILLPFHFFLSWCPAKSGSLPNLEGKQEVWKLYSRGNDDLDEKDEKGTSNFETAQVRVTLVSGRDDRKDIALWILYHALLTADDYRVIANPQWKVRLLEDNLDESMKSSVKKLDLTIGPGGQTRDSSFSAAIFLGTISKGDGKYQGVAGIDSSPADAEKPRPPVQTISWSVEVEKGQVKSAAVSLAEKDRKGLRPANELLRLIRTQDQSKPLTDPFPTKVGKARGPAQIGDGK